jgi:2-oxoglutarate ferredoxin oxidoreductase subunit beta
MVNIAEITTKELPNWCPGCGNFGILAMIKKAIVELEYDIKDIVIVSGIGCSSKISHYLKTYAYEGLHGRTMPAAMGIRLANPKLKVIVMGGDGDGYGIGLGHLMACARRNLDITYLVHDNEIYGLTTGQYSPTTPKGEISRSTPHGSIENPLVPLAVTITAGATFVARANAMDMSQSVDMIKKALSHTGFSHVDILQPCPSYNHLITPQFLKEHCHAVPVSFNDRIEAYKYVMEENNQWATGVVYETSQATYEEEAYKNIKIQPLDSKLDTIDVDELL